MNGIFCILRDDIVDVMVQFGLVEEQIIFAIANFVDVELPVKSKTFDVGVEGCVVVLSH